MWRRVRAYFEFQLKLWHSGLHGKAEHVPQRLSNPGSDLGCIKTRRASQTQESNTFEGLDGQRGRYSGAAILITAGLNLMRQVTHSCTSSWYSNAGPVVEHSQPHPLGSRAIPHVIASEDAMPFPPEPILSPSTVPSKLQR